MNFPAGDTNPQIPGSRGGDRELGQRAPSAECGGRGPAQAFPQQQPWRTQGACAAPRPAPDREGALLRRRNFGGPGLWGAGERQDRKCARSEASVPVTNSVAARSGSGVKRTQASPTAFLPGALLSGVLAARAVAVRVVAWLLLWEAAGLTCTAVTALTASPGDAGIRATCSEIILRQEVLKDGFHRDLLIKVKFGESIEDLQTCRLLIKQYIPTGLFVDPYELASLRERNITEAVMVSENFNIEAPNYLSKESEVLIYARQDSQCIDCFQAFLPVHYRYHRPHSKDGETFIVLNNPDLLMYCDQEFPILKCWAQSEVAAPCALKTKDICQWNNMKYKSVYKNVTLQVPVGLTIHTSLVCSVTLLITILCSTLILVAVFKYGHFSL